MKKIFHKSLIGFLSFALLLSIAGCGGGGGSSSTASGATTLGGGGSKGPFKLGSPVVAYKLVNGLRDINRTTTTTDNKGSFSFGTAISWTGATEFVISGDYLNENTGTYMNLPVSQALSAVTDTTSSKVNINVFTNIAAPGIIAALKLNIPIASAKATAQANVAKLFNINLEAGVELTDLDLTDGTKNKKANAQLLLVSASILKTANPEQVMQSLATDMKDGEVDDSALGALQELKTKAAQVNLEAVAATMSAANIGVAPLSIVNPFDGLLSFDNNISFTKKNDAFLSTSYTSNTATVVGIQGTSAAAISVSGGSYSIDGGAFVTTAGTITNGQNVRVRGTSSASYSTSTPVTLTIGGGVIVYNIQTQSNPFVADTTPNSFTFGYKNNQALNAMNVTSQAVIITGINTAANISIDVGTFDINSSNSFATSGTITNGSTVRVRNTASATAGTQVKSTVTIGDVNGTFSSFTVPEDTSPNQFTFADANDVNKTATATVNSNTITISGINTASDITVTGGKYKINAGGFTDVNATGAISSGDTLQLQAIPSDNFDTTTVVTVTVGNVISTFNVTTMSDPVVVDATPNAFSFASKFGQAVSSNVDTNMTVSGINTNVFVSIINGTYSVNGGGQDSNVSNGDVIVVTQTTSADFETEKVTTLTVGGVSSTFKTKTISEDKTPDVFSFDANSSVVANTLATSNTITIAGLSTGTTLPISIVNGEYNSGAGYTTAAGTVSNGDTVTIQQTSALTQGTSKVTTLTIGSVVRSFTTTTVKNAPAINGTPATTVAEDSLYSFQPDTNATSGEIASWSITGKPSWATFNTVNGLLSGTPLNANVGVDTNITITATNSEGSNSITAFDITVTNTNDAPIAVADANTTLEETPITVNVVANDTDVDVGDTLTVTAVSNPLATFSGGTVTYNPALNFVGTDSVTYTISDGHGGTSTSTLIITVLNVNDAPVAGTFTPLTTVNQDALYTFTALATDVDINATLTYSITGNPTWMDINTSTGVVSGTPANADVGTTTGIQVRVTDGIIGSPISIATFNVTVNNVQDPATISGTIIGSVQEDTTFVVSNTLTITDIDINDSALIAQTNVAGAYGTFNVDTNGTWAYSLNNTLAAVQALTNTTSLTDTLNVSSKDGSATKTLTITINGSDDVATFGGTPIANAVEDTTMSTGATISVDDNDTNQSSVQAIVDLNTTYGQFNVATNGTWTYLVSNTPTIQALAQGEVLHDTTTVTSKDGNATEDLNVTITGTNDAPVANQLASQSIKKTADLNITLSATDVDNGATLTLTDATATGATVNFDANGSVTFNASTAGAYTLSYTFSDEHNATSAPLTTAITVTNSDAPVALGDVSTMLEDNNSSIDILANDSDDVTSKANLIVTVQQAPAHGTAVVESNNTITYAPLVNYNGTDTFIYKITDADGGFATADVNLTITAVNDAPTAVDDTNTTAEDNNITLNVVANDSDIDSPDFNVTAVSTPTHGSVTFTTNSVTYSPDANFNGNDSFTYTINDGALDANATVNITVTPVNDFPVLQSLSDITVNEDASAISVDLNATDIDINSINFTATSSDTTKATITLNTANAGNGTANRVLTITPVANQFGDVNITVTAHDGAINSLSDTKSFILTINPVNDAPTAVDGNFTILMNSGSASMNILANVSDVDNNISDLNITSCQDYNGTVQVNAQDILYAPTTDFTGLDSFTCTVSDGNLSVLAPINVTVSGNHAPVAQGASFTLVLGDTITGNVHATDADVNDTLTYSATPSVEVSGAGTTIDSDGNFSITGYQIGTGNISVTITDDGNPQQAVSVTYSVKVIAAQSNNNVYDFSNVATADKVTNFSTATTIATPGDTLLHSFYGNDVNGTTTLTEDTMEFNTTSPFALGGNSLNGKAFHDNNLNGVVQISEDTTNTDTIYNATNKTADWKTVALLDAATASGLAMPSGAQAYQVAIQTAKEMYDFWGELKNYNVNPATSYSSLSSFVNATGSIIESQQTNYRTVLLFDANASYSNGSGTIVEADMTNVYDNSGTPYILNPNAGTWTIVHSPLVDNNNSAIVLVTPTDTTKYKTKIFVYNNFGVKGSTTNTVWQGEYNPVGYIMNEIDYNDIAAQAIKDSVASSVLVDPYIVGAILCEDVNINGICDSGEQVSSATTSNGQFSFSSALTPNSHIIIKTQGLHAGKVYDVNLSAIVDGAGKVNVVSPMTTLVSRGLTDVQLAQILNKAAADSNITWNITAQDVGSNPLASGISSKTIAQFNDTDLVKLQASLVSYGMLKIMNGTALKSLAGTALFASGMNTDSGVTNGALYQITKAMIDGVTQSLNNALLSQIKGQIDTGRDQIIAGLTAVVGAPTATTLANSGLPEPTADLLIKVAVSMIDRLTTVGLETANSNSGDVATALGAVGTTFGIINPKIITLGQQYYGLMYRSAIDGLISATSGALSISQFPIDIQTGHDFAPSVKTVRFDASNALVGQ